MAEKISIDIPGIGQVQADGFASEETLQRIAEALEKSSKGLTKEQKEQAKATKDSTKAIKEQTEQTKAWVGVVDSAEQSLKNLALTATAVATKFIANYDTIAANPIKAGQALINTSIDLIGNFASSAARGVPIIGGFIAGAADATAALLKLANDKFAEQLEKNLTAMQEYTKTGIGFSGGLNDMQAAATEARVGIVDFAKAITKSKADLNLLGVSGGDAAKALAKNLGQLTKKGPGGLPSLRDQMFNLGFSYDQQIEIAAQYMGQMAASGKLEKMTKEELAQGTAELAKNMKVIADFTGKDAKEVTDRARKASQNAYLQATLSDNEIKVMQKVFPALEAFGDKSQDAQQAYMDALGGLAIDVPGFMQGPFHDAIIAMADGTKNGALTVENAFSKSADTIANAIPDAKRFMGDLGPAGLKKRPGEVTNMNAVYEALVTRKGGFKPGQVAEMEKNNEDQMKLADNTTKNLAKVYDQSQEFKVTMEGFLNSHLDWYAEKVAGAFDKASSSILEAMGLKDGGSKPPADEPAYKRALRKLSGAGVPDDYEAFADGGKIPSGTVGIVGEAGPEMVVGPGTVVNAAQMRENFAKMFEEQTKFLVNAKNPFRTALDDVNWTPGGDMSMPYDKVTGNVLEPNLVKDLSDKARGWENAVTMLSKKNTEMAEGMRNSTMGENGQFSEEMISSTNKQLLEATQQIRDAATQQTMHMADMLKQMGISSGLLGKVAMNTN